MSKPLNENITGIYSLMLTPYNEDLSVNYDVYERYCELQASQGVEHLFAVCGSSEMNMLTLEERLKLAALTVRHKGDTTVVATANMEPSWFAQVEEVKRMSQTGVDGIVFTTKGYGGDGERLISYIGELKQFTHLPVLMYEYPGIRPHLISGEIYGRLVRECGIRAIKDTTCTEEGIKAKLDNRGDSCVIQANMPYLFRAYELGSRGVMATPTTCGGAFFARFHSAFTSGDIELARRRYNEIILLDNAIDGGFNRSAKYLVSLQGIDGFLPISRGADGLTSAKLAALRSFYDWCRANGLY